ncbi:SLC13 family permease [Phycisphaera mikurensis]|uniref:Putative transporter n=1 Tax=Phycisphaera mikurensis (strain NBRC 102666 / KCTC 22515 / FYK2301M01) TaxID=1142394 RepID=I0IGC6_PHYMF|nr:SLC13 family permease [Phycisphaera mikurensis]MBB6440308.1 di/tricarboxylate transporter [Phycisphaera mikurensis]BAM04314.1 putative transporter [Phycisphaera mikurensis NBRC 102666]
MTSPWEAWAVGGVLVVVLFALARGWSRPDALMLGALAVVMTLAGFSDRLPGPDEAVAGFGSEALVTVALLFVVATAITRTGALRRVALPLLGRPRSEAGAQLRLAMPVAGLSAFLNNTPVVAMCLDEVRAFALRAGVAPSKLFLPLSYFSILGGVCTLVGTSTNLIVDGLHRESGAASLGMFGFAWVGVPCLLVGVAYLLVAGRWLLPDREDPLARGDARTWTAEVRVPEGSPHAGRSIEAAGLRSLPGLYLVRLERGDAVLPAVDPAERLHAGDRLVFAGDLARVAELRADRGLEPATDGPPPPGRGQAVLVEAIVAPACPLVGRGIREGRFRERYDAAVLAVSRDGARLEGKPGDVVLRAGDGLLLESRPGFVQRQRRERDFFFVTNVPDAAPPRHERAWWAGAVLVGLVLSVALLDVPMLLAAFWAAGLLWITRCVTASEARRSIDWEVLVVIGAAIGLGKAAVTSGLAAGVAGSLVSAVSALDGGPFLALVAVYAATSLFTELVSNNATAVLMYPIAVGTAEGFGADPLPFVMALAVAASASFATPIGYQTNLMVYGPGGYRFGDYLRVGVPLNGVVGLTACVVTPIVFPF